MRSRSMRGFLLCGLLIACGLSVPTSQAQSSSAFDQLERQTEQVGLAPEAQRAALRRAFVGQIRAALQQNTRQSAPQRWGELQVILSMNLMGDDQTAALSAANDALAVLNRQSEAVPWAYAQWQRMLLVWTDMANQQSPDLTSTVARMNAAGDAALSVFTIDAYPRENLMLRCGRDFLQQSVSGAGSMDAPIFSMPLIAVCSGPFAAFGDTRRSFLIPLLSQVAQGYNQAITSTLVTQYARMRATALSATLNLDQLGLSPADLQHARALRARADQIAAQTPGSGADEASLRDNRPYWRTLADLHDILLRANSPSGEATTLYDTIVAPFIMDQDQGLLAIVRPNGQAGMIAVQGSNVQRMVMQASNNMIGAGVAAWSRDYADRNVGPRQAIANFRQRFEAGWGVALHDAATAGGVARDGRLIVLADGLASGLPLGVLRDPRTGRSMIEDYEIVYTPSLAAYEAAHRRASTPRPATLAPIESLDAGLPFAAYQTKIAERIFSPGVVPVVNGDKASVLSALRAASYWQFSTHGSFNTAQPRLSGLELKHNPQIMLTLSDLYFSEQPLGAPNLVVLSACETALFDTDHSPDAFIGLPAGFLQAGAAGVIGSLWPVTDNSAALLMAKFYHLHLAQHQRPSLALRNAQLWLKNASQGDLDAYIQSLEDAHAISADEGDAFRASLDGDHPFADPFYWGAWVYYGA